MLSSTKDGLDLDMVEDLGGAESGDDDDPMVLLSEDHCRVYLHKPSSKNASLRACGYLSAACTRKSHKVDRIKNIN